MKRKKFKSMAVWGLLTIAVLFFIGLFAIADQSPEASMSFAFLTPLAFGITVLDRQEKIFDWSKVKDIGTIKEVKEEICYAFNEHLKKFSKVPINGQYVKFTGADPNLISEAPVILVHSDQPKMPDRGYELLFDLVDMRNIRNKTFDILNVSGGVTFYQQVEGEEAKLSKIPSAAKSPCTMLRFTGGFPILDDWLTYNEHYRIEELAADTVRNWYKSKATIFYNLLVALTGISEAFDTDDMTTINNACANMLNNLDGAGYAIDESASFVISCNPMVRSRILKAIRTTYMTPGPTTGSNQINFTISGVISTSKITDTTTYYVSLPGYKNKRGEWDDLNAREPQRNELKLGADHVWTGAYNGIIGEKKQHRKCSLS